MHDFLPGWPAQRGPSSRWAARSILRGENGVNAQASSPAFLAPLRPAARLMCRRTRGWPRPRGGLACRGGSDQRFGLVEPPRPIFPRALDWPRLEIVFGGERGFTRRQRPDAAERVRAPLMLGVARGIDRAEHHLVQVV